MWQNHPKAGKGIICEGEIRVSGGSRLRAKLLVFKTNKQMRMFFKNVLDREGSVCPKTLGICCALSTVREKYAKGEAKPVWEIYEVDPRYFCVVCLLERHLTLEIISHESVHAGFAYVSRQNQKQWVKGEDVLDEEEICYPAGRVVAGICALLHEQGLPVVNRF